MELRWRALPEGSAIMICGAASDVFQNGGHLALLKIKVYQKNEKIENSSYYKMTLLKTLPLFVKV